MQEAKTGPLTPTAPHPYQVLPHVSIGDVTGLIELVHSRGGREDLYWLGRHLQLELDDLLPSEHEQQARFEEKRKQEVVTTLPPATTLL